MTDPVKELKGKNIKEVQNGLENVFGKLKEETVKLAEEVKRIHTPKAQKTISINGKECFISLIEDGRIMIKFPDTLSSENYYEYAKMYSHKELIEFGESQYRSGINQGTAEGRSQKEIEFNKLSFFQRLFY